MLEKWRKAKLQQQLLRDKAEEERKMKEAEGIGTLKNDNLVASCTGLLRKAFMSNISMSQLNCMFDVELRNTMRPGLGKIDISELPRTYSDTVEKMEFDRIGGIISGCYSEFATISDGTPMKTSCRISSLL
jgi:hypothetical protein